MEKKDLQIIKKEASMKAGITIVMILWRDFAKEVDGLLRIGAVNCGDDRMLCRMKGVNSYPSLFIFRAGMC
ncbi:hypothetical protein CB1_001170005 [Camelus ferus]|nr:hypothetical protein CB1_001170005 [Camelus ferus]